MKYLIAEFTGPKKEIAIVPTSWVLNDMCYWPPFWKDSIKYEAAVSKAVQPDCLTWDLYKITVVGRKLFDSYDAAREHLTDAEEGSDFCPRELGRGKRNQSQRFHLNDSSEDEPEIPTIRPTHKRVRITKKKDGSSNNAELPAPPQLVQKETSLELEWSQDQRLYSGTMDTITSPTTLMISPSESGTTNVRRTAPNAPVSLSDTVISVNDQKDALIISILEYVKSIERNQQVLKVKLDTLSEMLTSIMRKTELNSMDPVSLTTAISLPIESISDFWKFNSIALASRSETSNMIKKLGEIGGNNGNQTTYRIMSALMTDDLMFKFTGKGRTGKENFSGSAFLSIVCESVRCNPKAKAMTDKEIEEKIDYWLRKAGTRLKKNNTTPTSETPLTALLQRKILRRTESIYC